MFQMVSILIQPNYTRSFNMFPLASFKKELAAGKQEKQILTTHKIFLITHIVQQINNSYDIGSNNKLLIDLQGSEWELSMIRISYKLTKKLTKNEKNENNYQKI